MDNITTDDPAASAANLQIHAITIDCRHSDQQLFFEQKSDLHLSDRAENRQKHDTGYIMTQEACDLAHFFPAPRTEWWKWIHSAFGPDPSVYRDDHGVLPSAFPRSRKSSPGWSISNNYME